MVRCSKHSFYDFYKHGWQNLILKLLGWYMVLIRIAKMSLEAFSRFFRNCSQIGTVAHILWQCQKWLGFWLELLIYFARWQLWTLPEPEVPVIALFQKLDNGFPKLNCSMLFSIMLLLSLHKKKEGRKGLYPFCPQTQMDFFGPRYTIKNLTSLLRFT